MVGLHNVVPLVLGNCLLDEAVCALFASFLIPSVRRDSVVGIETRYRLDGPGIDSRAGGDFPHPSRPALGHTGSVTVGTGFFPGGKAVGAWR
jgi:hypothetical protein